MADTESLRQVAHSRAPFSAWLGIMFLFALFGMIVLAIIGPSPRGNDYEQTRAKKRFEILKTEREEDTKALTTYAWIDKNKGSVRIPIERAMQLAVAELAQKKPATSYPIASPAAAAPAGPAPAATAAPSPAATAKPTPKASAVAGPQSENRSQPAAAANPPAAPPGTQPGASATPHASASPPNSNPSPSGTPIPSPAGTPLPVPGKTP
jgi:hypothetical protein